MAMLETKQLSFTYPDQKQPALDNVSLSVEPGEFVILCGQSGSGKSTLLRLIKREIAPHGKKEGDLFYKGQPLEKTPPLKVSKKIGFVFQDPENQIVMDQVFDELIFGMQNIGMETDEMRKRIAEITHFFGIHHLLKKETHVLSGGQMQMINLASILLMEPEILLLDEPTAHLDPIAAKDFLHIVGRMNREFGMTVIMVEHRLEDVLSFADRLIVLEEGRILKDGPVRQVINQLSDEKNHTFSYLPAPVQLYFHYSTNKQVEEIPLTIREGKKWVQQLNVRLREIPKKSVSRKQTIYSLENVDFRYEKRGDNILKACHLSVQEGEWLAIVGANGTGKSTLLKVMAGILRPQRGWVKVNGKMLRGTIPEIGYVPQNPKLLFSSDTIYEELSNQIPINNRDKGRKKLTELITFFNLESLLNRHPYDISGGEMQKVAIASVLLSSPKILLLDEPTRGLDPTAKRELGTLLKKLQEQNMTIVTITHDIEYAASFADRCAMMFQGAITVQSPTEEFFKGNHFYTTMINRMTRGSNVPEVITVEEAKEKWDLEEE
ncbi:ABC transporter ATP-binding protein [Fervidibacillus halotolerans]|uniref:Energy-coupling factor transporter ATPase n=1 Tax=Fervidibacillus halotolerans TaxID=2980027 RepID=A0A9E8LYR3_9BACI|nr:ABC transporter ATP-binding protein [Fervidibacillus halotolerans]WAA12253.1 energy-coupling factor transporter ATPase [Fervidibacillus halotolerans]